MSDSILIATRKGLFVLERSASGWKIARTAFLGDKLSLAVADPRDGSWYVAADLGHFGAKIHRSEDQGRSWSEIGVPEYPPQPEGEPSIDPWGKPLPWKLVAIWALQPGHPSQPGTIWCGTIPGGLFKSTDYGKTWELNRPLWDHPRRKNWFGGGADLPGIHSICIHPDDPNELVLAVSCGGVWATRDGGASWEIRGQGLRAEFMPPEKQFELDIQDAHLMVACPAAPEKMWIQHHNGIFRSVDRGMTFEEIKSLGASTFGLPVAVHPRHGDTAWFVPAVKDECRIPVEGKVSVTRTKDGGKTADVLTRGLPQEHAYDLVYRHALAVDRTGDRLAFGSTTGSAWTTENGGEEWKLVSTHLPPIYSVAFA